MAAVTLPHAAASAALARRRLASELSADGLPVDVVADAELMMGELFGNVVRHARPLPDGSVRAYWLLLGGRLRLAVTDGGSIRVPHALPLRPSATSGRGLSIVEALAAAWGVEPTSQGAVTVWAELDLTGRA